MMGKDWRNVKEKKGLHSKMYQNGMMSNRVENGPDDHFNYAFINTYSGSPVWHLPFADSRVDGRLCAV